MRIVEPSERNFTLFCDVEFGGLSLRAAAERYEISPTRVQQVVEQTRVWYRATTPTWAQECDPDLQPLVACRLLGDRLEHLYSQAMTAWTESQGRKSVEREGVHTKVVTTRDCYGEVRYLSQASRISEACCRAGLRLAKLMDQSSPSGTSPTATQAEPVAASAVPQIAPPEVGCALEASQPSQIADQSDEPDAATLLDDEAYERREATAVADSAAIIDFPNPVRTRQQRKQRRRELERKRRLAGCLRS